MEAANRPHGNIDDVVRALSPAVIGLLPQALAEATDLTLPMAPADLMSALGPALALVAGVMDQQLRTEWLVAAAEEMGNIPGDLALLGIAHARPRADHVSKIVPLALKHVEADVAQRRARVAMIERLAELAKTPTIPEPVHGIDGFFDTTDPQGLLDSVRAKLTASEFREMSRTPGGPPPLPYRDRALRSEGPAVSDASENLKRMVFGADYMPAASVEQREHDR